MTANSTEEHSSKVKFLILLVALLLCGVAMAGTAYAYSSSVTDDTQVTSETDSALALDFKENANKKIYFDIALDNVSKTKTYTVNTADSADIVKVTITTKMTTIDTPVITVYKDASLTQAENHITATPSEIQDGVFTISFSGTAMNEVPLDHYYLKVVVGGQVTVSQI